MIVNSHPFQASGAAGDLFSHRQADHSCAVKNPSAKPDHAVRFSFRVENARHIEKAYGGGIIHEAVRQLHLLLDEMVGANGLVTLVGEGCLDLLIEDVGVLGAGPLVSACQAWLDSACSMVQRTTFGTSAGPVCLWLSGAWAIFPAGIATAPDAASATGVDGFRFTGDPVQDNAQWERQYCKDMAVAARVCGLMAPRNFDQSAEEWITLFWQAVRDPDDEKSVLYFEALARFVSAKNGERSPGTIIECLERIGFSRAFDEYIFDLVLAELERSPEPVIGVNVSAKSVAFDPWWEAVEQRLRSNPGVASRLVIEITETAALPSISLAAQFISRMRRLGCRIALDDFGVGFTSVQQLVALAPDIVKIDKFFMVRALRSARDVAVVVHLAGLARAAGATVIAEGIETSLQADIARRAQIDWQQGHIWGAATASRPWRTGCLRAVVWPNPPEAWSALASQRGDAQFGSGAA